MTLVEQTDEIVRLAEYAVRNTAPGCEHYTLGEKVLFRIRGRCVAEKFGLQCEYWSEHPKGHHWAKEGTTRVYWDDEGQQEGGSDDAG